MENTRAEMLAEYQQFSLHSHTLNRDPQAHGHNNPQHLQTPHQEKAHRDAKRKRKHLTTSSSSSGDRRHTTRPLSMTRDKKHHGRKSKKYHRRYTSMLGTSSSTSHDSKSCSSKKFGAFRNYSDHVRLTFKWPNEYIGREDGNSPTYDDMTFTELIFWLMSGLLEQIPRTNRNQYVSDQLHYCQELFRDLTTSTLADCHRRVLEALEKEEINPRKWSEWNVRRREALDKIHRTAAAANKSQKPRTNQPNNTTPNKNTKRARPCTHWNQGKCEKGQPDHKTASILWLHVCSYCFTLGDRHRHRESVCYKKANESPKTGKGPSRGAN